jgi:predicted DNA-binding transcriptional regulator AlpA
MSVREFQRRAEQRRRSDPVRDREIELNQQVLRFSEWCALVGVSAATGRRILKSGSGPVVTRLSTRRIGISRANHVAWLASREQSA